MAGNEGFEPPDAGTKNQCLTTWRIPNVSSLYHQSFKYQLLVPLLFIFCWQANKGSALPLGEFPMYLVYIIKVSSTSCWYHYCLSFVGKPTRAVPYHLANSQCSYFNLNHVLVPTLSLSNNPQTIPRESQIL
jgi:hypothetical protein